MQDNKEWLRVIQPKNGVFNVDVSELLKKKDLIALFVRREFVAKYKQTILGPAWAIIQPLLTTVVFTLIFGNIANLSADGVPSFIFYLSGTIIWTFFSNCFTQTANTFIANSDILSKVYFPRLVMPISTVLSQLISFVIQFAFMICFLVYYCVVAAGVQPNLYILLTPVLLLQMGMLGLGFGIIVSALTTKYRDLAMLITFGVQLWQYASPVAYDISIIPDNIYNIYMLNPVTPIILAFKYAYLGIGQIPWLYYWISWGTTAVVLFVGILLFSRVEKTFMDTI
jgi:lipopolysaccharide transport system permease protein